jgi:hypothetical protein
MEKITFDSLKISSDKLLDKVKADIQQGVTIDTSNFEHTKLTKVWTDSKEWQFVIIGMSTLEPENTLKAVEIQSTGQSKLFLRMKIQINDNTPEISFQKLALKFAQIEEISHSDAQQFIEAYLVSTFNRTLTSELFDELAHDKNYFNWLSY